MPHVDAEDMPQYERLPTPVAEGFPVQKHPITVIFNPRAGKQNRQKLARILSAVNGAVQIRETEGAGHARVLAKQVSSDSRLFVAGGDGTINEALNGLMDCLNEGRTAPQLGIIPMGTANVLAIEIGLVHRHRPLIAYLNDPQIIRVRPGLANDRAFLLMVGAGPDAHTVAHISPRLKARIGKWAYVWQGLHTILRAPGPIMTVTIGPHRYRAAGLIATHASHYAGRYVIAPDANLTRDALNIVLMSENSRSALARYALSLVLNRLHTQSDVQNLTATELQIDCLDGEVPLQIDGEYLGASPCRVSLSDKSIDLLVPTSCKPMQSEADRLGMPISRS